jgi:curved DNA-binding protein CbpA
VQTFYQLLSLEPSATAEEIKKAFRAEIARYHPDKVQHLGKEFQEMAATRAAQLTEAYRTLMNPALRSEYDRLYVGSGAAAAPAPSGAAPKAPAYESPPQTPHAPHAPADAGVKRPPRFAKEHATRDEFVKKATLGRIRQAMTTDHGSITELSTKGFDFDCSVTSKKLFGRGDAQRIAVRFVPIVDRAAIQDTWASAQKAGGRMCVLLMGNGMTSARELADAITEMRKKSRGEGGVSIIPIDVRDWSAHIPADAPPSCKNILQRLRDVSNI